MLHKRDRDEAYVEDILGAAEFISEYVSDLNEEEFASDHMRQDAVIRQMGIIGEAAANFSDGFKSKHDQIPWKTIKGLRRIVIHAYWQVKIGMIWEMANKDVPELAKYLRKNVDLE